VPRKFYVRIPLAAGRITFSLPEIGPVIRLFAMRKIKYTSGSGAGCGQGRKFAFVNRYVNREANGGGLG